MGRRHRVRSLAHRHCLFSAERPGREPEFLRRVSEEHGQDLVKRKQATRYNDPDTGECLGYQLTPNGKPVGLRERAPKNSSSEPSSAVPTRHEQELAIGVCGDSTTQCLPEWMRRRPGFEPDDVELAQIKVDAFAPMYRA